MNNCTCLIHHPKDKKDTIKRLEDARQVGDNVGIIIALVQLAPCKTRKENK